MSKYTTTIKSLIDNKFDFGLDKYPIFDENYREVLNNKILNYYYMDEIGFETAELFKFHLNNKMELIMSYYNALYEKLPMVYENLDRDVNMTEEFKRTNDTTSENNSASESTNKGNSENKNVLQRTPQGILKDQNINNFTYASEIQMGKNDTNSSINDKTTTNGKINNTDEYIKHTYGSNGKKYGYEIFKGLKDNLINIDKMVIDDLSDLFMGIM